MNMKKFIVLTLFALLCALPATVSASWASLGGYANDIAVDENTIWVIGSNDTIWFRTLSTEWREYRGAGRGRAIAAAKGTPWIIGYDNGIFRGNGAGWTELPGNGRGLDIAVDPYERPWIIGTDNRIYFFVAGVWREYAGNGQGKAIAISPQGIPYIVGMDNAIYRGTGSGWVQLSGDVRGTDIAVDYNGTPWIVGTNQETYYYKGTSWHRTSGRLSLRLSCYLNRPYVVGTDHAVWKFQSNTL
jgi:hypothetical protein